MPTGYQRQSVASIVNGNVINAADFNNEYNAILAAFNASTGHIHDGTTVGGGSPILAVNGVAYPATPTTNTVPVVTSSNTITYEAVPNAALANSKVTLGSTDLNLGATVTSVAGLTLSAPTFTGSITISGPVALSNTITGGTLSGATLAGCATSGTLTLGGNVTATGRTITGGTYASPTLTGTTNVTTLILNGAMTATGHTITDGTFIGPTINGNPVITGSPSIVGAALTGATTVAALTTSGVLTLGSGLTATGQTVTGGTFNAITLGSGAGTGASLGATLNITGQSIVGGGTGTIVNCSLDTNCVGVTQSTANSSTKLATTAYVQNNLTSYATLDSPALTGTPTAPTQAATSNSTRLATTAYVQSQYTATNAANGYLQTGNGQPYMQWGTAVTNGSGLVNITFPNAFGSAVYSIQITPTGSLSNLTPKVMCYSDTITNSGFRAHTFDNTNTATVATIYWTAIGI